MCYRRVWVACFGGIEPMSIRGQTADFGDSIVIVDAEKVQLNDMI